VKETVDRMLDNQAASSQACNGAFEQAGHGELLKHKEVLGRIDRLFHSRGGFGGRERAPTSL
jgi:hypothetical protein